MRIVFDAAGEYDGMSLNKALLTGPDLQNNLVGVLLRLRNHTFAIAADIEAMYHQIRISKSDANSLRFFWQDDLTQDVPEIYQMVVHIFGGKDSPCCANYGLKKIGRDDFDEYDASAIESALKSFYMDDFLKSVISEVQAITLCQEMIQVMESSGFNLTKFISNSDRVSKALSNNKYEKTTQDLEIDAERVEKTLGISWKIKDDKFVFTKNMKVYSLTKRGILIAVSFIFDPLGFLTPFILKAKLLIQLMWRKKMEWDDEVPQDIGKAWNKWLDGIKENDKVQIDRCYHHRGWQCSDIQLHTFCDASESAYGTVAYLHFTLKDGTTHCCFVMEKSRLASIRTQTMPRLELDAAVIGVKLYNIIIHEITCPLKKPSFGQTLC